jgi:tRNA nucleotidyltransferase (CCA-adding enzyme)
MKIYLVGGAVRDELLGLSPKEKDWVVVGATADDMLQQGFRSVGKDFPVFLHPETAEEYALARTERKVGRGYTGFTFDTSSQVTLEEDLKRRDLTINAMAKTSEGQLIDPYHGKADLEKKILRHVSPAFSEDPVRILRVARFAARYSDLGFHVAKETNELMKQMVASGEVDALVAERVWKELERALTEKHPEKFFQILNDCGAILILFPKISDKEVMTLEKTAKKFSDPQVRFAALLYFLSEKEINQLCDRYRVPSDYRDLAIIVEKNKSAIQDAKKLTAKEFIKLFLATDAYRREERFKKFLSVCESIFPSETNYLLDALQVTKNIDTKKLMNEGKSGKEIGENIHKMREDTLQSWLDRNKGVI